MHEGRGGRRRAPRRAMPLLAVAALLAGGAPSPAAEPADTALVLAVDVSSSVDEARFRLQMEGIANALEDESVQRSILSGPQGRVWLALVPWADTAQIAVPWRSVGSAADARALAAQIRALPRRTGEFTCLGRMLRQVRGRLLADLPGPVDRVVVDVSGDGIDNCDPTAVTEAERDATVASGATINGLPILVPGENDVVGTGAYRAPGYDWTKYRSEPHAEAGTTLPDWFRRHLVGGEGAFILPASGYGEFDRAFRRKFVTEVSGGAPRDPGGRVAETEDGRSRLARPPVFGTSRERGDQPAILAATAATRAP